jgi:ubiquinone/menaquinone biosynthesis C-methylase UbiE
MSGDGKTGTGVTQGKVAEDFDRFTESYETIINDAISFGGREHAFYIDVKRDAIVRLAADYFGDLEKLDVLDLGCGIGAYHPGLEGKFHELHGIDVSERSIDYAKARAPFVHYETFDGGRLPYTDARFDLAYTICVMHHVPPAKWQEFVAEMRRVLKPGGLALVFEHNPYNPATQYIVRSCEIDKDAVLLRPGALRRMFRGAAFDHVRTRTILSVPPSGAFLASVDDLLGHLPFGAQYYLAAQRPKS